MSEVHVEPTRAAGSSRGAPGPAVADSDLRRDAPYRQWVRWAVVGDIATTALAATLARAISIGLDADVLISSKSISYTIIGTVVVLLWPVIVAVCGGYDLRSLLVGVEEMRRLVRAAISLLALLGFVFFTINLDVSRGYVASLVPFMLLFTGLWRYVLRSRGVRMQRAGEGKHRAVAVGPIDDLQRLCARLNSLPESPIDLVAIVVDDLDLEVPVSGPLRMVRRLANRDAMASLLDQGNQIDLLVRAGRPAPEEVWALARRAHELQAGLAIAPNRDDASAHMALSYVPLGHTPMLVVETPTLHPVALVTKAIFDRTLGFLMVVALAPVLAGIALAILIKDGRPIFYSQTRVGRHGETFRCFKFRTMHPGADQRLEELLAQNEADGPLFKMRDDPRVTKIGGFLRGHSLDELPQLFNVLGGSMSIVGPRPPLPHEAATYNEREARRLLVKPGLTGLWQVQGRSDLPWDEGVYLDLLYVDHWSPLLDMAIVLRTVKAVLRPTGAY